MHKGHLSLHHSKSEVQPAELQKPIHIQLGFLTHQAGLFCSLHVSQLSLLMLLKMIDYKSFSQGKMTYNYAVYAYDPDDTEMR